MDVSIGVIGSLQLHVNGEDVAIGGPRARTVLAALAARPDQGWPIESLIEEVWGDSAPPSARNTLQSYVSRLRKLLGGPDRIVQEGEHYRLAVSEGELDSLLFEARHRMCASAADRGDWEATAVGARAALDLWRGEPFADVPELAAGQPWVASLGQTRTAVIDLLARAELARGEAAGLVGELHHHIEAEPWSEPLREHLARALAATGRRTEALRSLAHFRDDLVEATGLEPTARIAVVEQELLADDGGRPTERRPAAALPADLARLAKDSMVGRTASRARLEECRSDARDVAHLAFVTGEAGVGKSRLAAAIAETASHDGAVVLYGRCTERLDLAYQPIAQALGRQGRDLWEHGGEDVVEASSLSIERGRHRLFTSVAETIAELAEGGAVLVVDDLHWASGPTLALLEHLVSVARPPGLLVVATLRGTDIAAGSAPATVMAEMERRGDGTVIALEGLDQGDVASYLRAQDLDDSPDVASSVWRATAGNALLLAELAQEAVEAGEHRVGVGESSTVPFAIAALVDDRMARLGVGADVLRVAAVMGEDFELSVLESVVGPEVDALAVLEAAGALGLVDELGPDLWQFRHGLTRDALSVSTAAGRRRRFHGQVAEAIEAVLGPDTAQGRRAHHLCRSADPDRAIEAIELSVIVAEQRVRQLSADEALRHLDEVRPVVDRAGPIDPELETRLHLAAATAHHQRFEEPEWLAAADAAHDAARRAGSGRLLVRAAVARNPFWTQGHLDQVAHERLLEAAEELGEPTDHEGRLLKSRLLSHLSGQMAVTAGGARALGRTPLELASEALGLAEALADHGAELVALNSQLIALWSGPFAERQRQLTERIATVDHPEAQIFAARWRAAPELILGDRQAFEKTVGDLVEGATAIGWHQFRAYGMQCQAMMAMVDGHFDEGLELGAAAVEVGRQHPNFTRIYEAQLFWAAYEQGRLETLMPFVRAALDDEPDLAAFHAMLGVSHCETGDLDGARRQLQTLAVDDFGWIPRDILWTSAVAGAVEIAANLEDQQHASVLAGLLGPYAGQVLVVAGSAFVYGAIDRFRAMAAALAGDESTARAAFTAAAELEDSIDAPRLVACTSRWRDRLLN